MIPGAVYDSCCISGNTYSLPCKESFIRILKYFITKIYRQRIYLELQKNPCYNL